RIESDAARIGSVVEAFSPLWLGLRPRGSAAPILAPRLARARVRLSAPLHVAACNSAVGRSNRRLGAADSIGVPRRGIARSRRGPPGVLTRPLLRPAPPTQRHAVTVALRKSEIAS